MIVIAELLNWFKVEIRGVILSNFKILETN